MRLRRDGVFISSVLFTIALSCLVPWCWRFALAGRDKTALEALDAGYRAAAHTMGDFGIACLTILSIGLLVTWTGYVKTVRWAWFVMFIIVWLWAFPILVLPLFQGTIVVTLREWISLAITKPGEPRAWAGSVLIFALMFIALVLPIKAFFLSPDHDKSKRG